jgi:hypothetical protein
LTSGQHQTPWNGHDDDNIVQTHSSHVHQINRQDFIANLKEEEKEED